MGKYRTEMDSLGPVRIADSVYYGAQTARARENFPVSGIGFPPAFIQALALIKGSAAQVNHDLGLLDEPRAEAILSAAEQVMAGDLMDQFVVDIFQTGSGTSTNMNMNEVIAGRANEILTGRRGGKDPVHPNDHVNLGQSSNDVIPSALHIAALRSIDDGLLPALATLGDALRDKSHQFRGVTKIGRTHLQDAVPLSLGDEFSGYARQLELAAERLNRCRPCLEELALGGTAVGTGVNTHREFAARVIGLIRERSGLPFREATNHFEAQGSQDAAVETSGVLKTVAVSLMKMANDIRLLASGPRCGLGEIRLPALQPGSSIMPGKVNPVIPEVVVQVSAQVMGNDLSISLGGQWGFLELNTMLPLIAHNLLQSISLLASAARLFAARCVTGIEADRKRCDALVERSLAMATFLVPRLGYDRAAEIAKQALAENKTVREVVLERGLMSEEGWERLVGGGPEA